MCMGTPIDKAKYMVIDGGFILGTFTTFEEAAEVYNHRLDIYKPEAECRKDVVLMRVTPHLPTGEPVKIIWLDTPTSL